LVRHLRPQLDAHKTGASRIAILEAFAAVQDPVEQGADGLRDGPMRPPTPFAAQPLLRVESGRLGLAYPPNACDNSDREQLV